MFCTFSFEFFSSKKYMSFKKTRENFRKEHTNRASLQTNRRSHSVLMYKVNFSRSNATIKKKSVFIEYDYSNVLSLLTDENTMTISEDKNHPWIAIRLTTILKSNFAYADSA